MIRRRNRRHRRSFTVSSSTHTAGVPVRRARVRLSSSTGGSVDSVSDRAGRFRAPLDAGRYTLTATKDGYTASRYGQVRFGGPGVAFDVPGADAAKPLTVALWRGGVISGRVVDENGVPAVLVEVRVGKPK